MRRRSPAYQRRLRSLLCDAILPTPRGLTEVNGARVAVRYFSADPHTGLGGDWHVTLPIAHGDVMLAVGDVAGHGPSAISTMVQLRHATAAFALVEGEPAAVLRQLNTVLCQLDDPVFASVVVARYRVAERTLTWACAGHLPILLASRNRVAPPRRQARGIILGVDETACYEQVKTRLRHSDMVLMYTDGVVETRGRSIDDGVRAFSEEVLRSLQRPSTDRLTAILRTVRRNPDDDVCLVGVEPAVASTSPEAT